MKKPLVLFIAAVVISTLIFWFYVLREERPRPPVITGNLIELPEPRVESNFSVEEAILNRRSRRDYKDESLTIEELSQLLWSAQGITERYKRTAPSAGALYPLEVYVVVRDVDRLAGGIYRYVPDGHSLVKIPEGNFSGKLTEATLRQQWVGKAPINLVFTAVYERTTKKYGERGVRYVHMEAGHAAQNVYLQAEALGLGTVVIGAFNDNGVREVMGLEENETPLYIVPVGRV